MELDDMEFYYTRKQNWERRYYIVLRLLIFIVIIWNIHILVLATRIEQKDNEIWQQRVEIEDLKEQLDRERRNK
nr:MAG TPA: Type II secretion system, protein M [Caudoviricetes sp.]